jgi:hypothetical protein
MVCEVGWFVDACSLCESDPRDAAGERLIPSANGSGSVWTRETRFGTLGAK